MSQYKHGVYIQEEQTSLVTPALAESALPVVVGVAPVHNLPDDVPIPVNVPKLCYSLQDFENIFGKPGPDDRQEDYKLWQTANIYFQRYAVAPLVAINVFDPSRHITDAEEGETARPDPSRVSVDDIIGTSSLAGVRSGLALIDEIFPRFRLNPGLILAPGFAKNPAVAKAIETACVNISSVFTATGLIEIGDEVKNYSEAPAWLNDNNLCDASGNTIAFFGDCIYNGIVEPGSAHLAGCIGGRDQAEGSVPYWSPSNFQLECSGLVHAGKELFLTLGEANYLNGQGIVTGLNMIGGLRCWGDQTTAYPGITDVKDASIPIRRMFSWIGNTLVLTDLGLLRKISTQTAVAEEPITILTGTTCKAFRNGKIVAENADGEVEIGADLIVMAVGSKPKDVSALEAACASLDIPCYKVGDAVCSPGFAMDAIHNAYDAVLAINA